jgi:hypothetical protein
MKLRGMAVHELRDIDTATFDSDEEVRFEHVGVAFVMDLSASQEYVDCAQKFAMLKRSLRMHTGVESDGKIGRSLTEGTECVVVNTISEFSRKVQKAKIVNHCGHRRSVPATPTEGFRSETQFCSTK